MNTNKLAAILAAMATAASLALAQGPGGGGGFPGGGNQPGGGGNQPGGGGTLVYDDFLTVCTTNSGIVLRDATAIGAVSTATSLAAPSGMTAILPGAFAGNTALTSANLSAATGLAEIPASAFAGCTALKTVSLPSSVTAIGDGAFEGCTALSTVTAPGLAAIGRDAFRGCTALAAIPGAPAAIGDYAFAHSGLAAVDAGGLAIGDGAFAGCTALATLANAPDALPEALCSGCTALDFPDLSGKTLGAAALAGIPTAAFTVSSATTFGDGALAAAEATQDTVFALADGALPACADTAYLGRSVGFTPDGTSDVAALGAFHLVAWLREQAASSTPAVDPPASYNTADLETWLETSGHATAYAYASRIASDAAFEPLALSGETNAFAVAAPDAGISIDMTPVGCYSLSVASPEWLPENIVLEPATGLYRPAQETALFFAALLYTWTW